MYSTDDVWRTIQTFVETQLVKMGKYKYEEIVDHKGKFEEEAKEELGKSLEKYGIKMETFKLQSVTLPDDITKAKKNEIMKIISRESEINSNKFNFEQQRIKLEHELETNRLIIENNSKIDLIKSETQKKTFEMMENAKAETQRKAFEMMENAKLEAQKKKTETKADEIKSLIDAGLDKNYFNLQVQFEELSKNSNTKWIIPSGMNIFTNGNNMLTNKEI
jgi:regulator of protease activity HflC (stomatin/prohibitin superfamily)